MSKINKKLGLIGAGNMGEAIIGAVIRSDILGPDMIFASDINQDRLKNLQNAYGINIGCDNIGLFNDCDIIALCIKPQDMVNVLSGIAQGGSIRQIYKKKLIISVAAGIPIKKIEDLLYAAFDDKSKNNLPVVRVMPNTPALVLSGMSGMSVNCACTEEDINTAKTILNAMGKVLEFKEEDLDSVTALSGSGPAYVFYLIEAMILAGEKLGLDHGAAQELSLQTIKGAVKLLEEKKETPESLRKKVTSPGGTTQAALNVFEARFVKQGIVEGIIAAAKRSAELSRL